MRQARVQKRARIVKRIATAVAAVVAPTLLCGCGILDIQSFIDPSEMYPYTKKTLQKPIITSLSTIDPSIDDPNNDFYNATDVTPADLLTISSDYKIGKGDLVTVAVNDLVGLGVETTKETRVSESGNISMPLLGQIKAEGYTEDELQKAIADAYRNQQIITNAQVSVTVNEERQRTFSALGAVNGPGEYPILQTDFRMLNALVTFRDVPATEDIVYVIRRISEDPPSGSAAPTPATAPAVPASGTPTPPPSNTDPLAPKGDVIGAANRHSGVALGATGQQPLMLQAGGDPLAAKPAPAQGDFTFGAPAGPAETRTIRVPLAALRSGEFKYNIVIRPHDLIIAPNPPSGEYYMSGHVARVGVYTVPATGITLKQAIVSAGMLDGVAIPQRTEIVRRLGPNRECFVALDTNAIFSGAQPDLFLKPNDIIHVGTNILAPFIAAVRGGFRITYGFGFLYDKNYS